MTKSNREIAQEIWDKANDACSKALNPYEYRSGDHAALKIITAALEEAEARGRQGK